jgi:hypothetical protein
MASLKRACTMPIVNFLPLKRLSVEAGLPLSAPNMVSFLISWGQSWLALRSCGLSRKVIYFVM